jgi:hypothetical protein
MTAEKSEYSFTAAETGALPVFANKTTSRPSIVDSNFVTLLTRI